MPLVLPDGKYVLARPALALPAHHGAAAAVAGTVLAAPHIVAGASPVPLITPGLWLTGLERWILLAGLAVALGGLAGRGLARHYQGPAPAPLPDPWVLRGSMLGAVASALLLVTALADTGLAVRLAQPHAMGLPPDSTVPIAAAELVFFAGAALAARLGRDSASAWPLTGAVMAEALRSHNEAMIPAAGAALTFCHLLPAVLWAGMLFYVLRAAFAWRAHPPAMQGLIRQYGTAAAWLLAVVAVTGVFSALVLVPLGSLLTTSYGRFLILKAALVGVAACLAVGGRLWLRSHPRPGAGPALATKLEAGALAAVLAVTALLTVLTPPAKPVYSSSGLGPASYPASLAGPRWEMRGQREIVAGMASRPCTGEPRGNRLC